MTDTTTTTFLIEQSPDDTHHLRVSRGAGGIIYITTNHRELFETRTPSCAGCSDQMAEQLLKGLIAILRGGFTEAITERELQMRQHATASRAARVTQSVSAPAPRTTRTTLDQL
jgi:hypothetical protein